MNSRNSLSYRNLNRQTNKPKVPNNKVCSGLSCENYGICILQIKYINKPGWFCEACKNDLLANDLVIHNLDHISSNTYLHNSYSISFQSNKNSKTEVQSNE
ncbi:hypothetical protein NMY3_00375 [Candidatus Nitrosocosmicus oleophilus]|uniref:Uncharacterized protein n=1 Tax=Candidatus Nitrosocosmicus oleophilus TaxID=1353260 RepID=A0A654LW52_9ARCH|nr:hypothetical protein NMY3_00375 [Candidatus Nitrosocosmicus oleophilus]